MECIMEETANRKTYRNYLFFWSGQLFSLFGSTVVYFVIMWWITITYQSALFLAIATFLYILPMIVFMPIAGVFSDRKNRKTLILIVDSLQAFLTFLMILFFQIGIVNILIIFILISLRSICQAFHLPTVNAIIPTMVPKKKLTKINAITFLFNGLTQILAQLVGAILWTYLTINVILWIDIVTFFTALIPLLLIKIPFLNQNNNNLSELETLGKKSFKEEFRMGVKIILAVPGLIKLLVLAILLNFLIRPLYTLMSLYININHGGSEVHFALTLMIFQLGIIMGSILTSIKKKWHNKNRKMFISYLFATIGYMIFALAPPGSFFVIGVGGFLLGFNLPIMNSLYQTFIQSTIPAEKLGRVISIDHALTMAMSPLGTIIAGPLAENLGISSLFFYCALIGIILIVIFWNFTGIRKIDMDV